MQTGRGACVLRALVALFTCALLSPGTASILERMENDPDLSQFCYMIKNNQEANFTLQYKSVTIFAPINAAFQKFPRTIDNTQFYLALYHMGSMARTTDQLTGGTFISSELGGHPPLWITVRVGPYHDDIFVNNARLILNQSNIKGKYNGLEQVVHKIDEVLVPAISPKNAEMGLAKPYAIDFLKHFEQLDVNPYRLRNFRERVEKLQKEDVFSSLGGHTFFIPIDEGTIRSDLIDDKTIDGHLIPKRILFTAPTRLNEAYVTAANGDNLKVYITFFRENNDKTETIYVKSETRVGDSKHTPGVVIAEIVKANIPVENGVIHLIQKPLMVVDTTVKQFLQEKEEGPLSKFVEAISDAGDLGKEFLKTIERARDVTLFAPSNVAWADGNLKNIYADKAKLREILFMHLVVDARLTKDQIVKNNKRQIYQAPTLNPRKNLYFNVAGTGENSTLSVEGGGVNATVIQANIAATNGIIHIIDRVLGVPYTTVQDKLLQDPMLNHTLFLGMFGNFNAHLNNTMKQYTYFVPRDKAWTDAGADMPATVNTLFKREYGYYAQQILERHLVDDEVAYTMERIKQLTNDPNGPNNLGIRKETELRSQRGILRISVEERPDHSFVIHWRGLHINVFRPNVECTNGIIHVIDYPFLQPDDIRITRDSASLTMLAPHLVMLIFVKLLL